MSPVCVDSVILTAVINRDDQLSERMWQGCGKDVEFKDDNHLHAFQAKNIQSSCCAADSTKLSLHYLGHAVNPHTSSVYLDLICVHSRIGNHHLGICYTLGLTNTNLLV